MSPFPLGVSNPVPFSFDVEEPKPDEGETIQNLIDTMLSISKTTCEHSGHAMRSVHVKSHGLLVGELEVIEGLPDRYRQGLFAETGKYPLMMRFSTPPGDVLADRISLPRALAIKIIGAKGIRLPGSESDITQDFLMVNGPAFQVADAKGFLQNLKPLAKTTDKLQGLKEVASTVLRGVEKVVESVGGESPKMKLLGGHPETNLLGETFYTQVPFRYGDYIAKLSVAPVSPALASLKDKPLDDVDENSNAIRDAVKSFFAEQSGEWEVRVQLCTDLKAMPVEDASVIWPEDQSPYIAVAKIRIPAQVSWSEARAEVMDDALSFSPWHGLEAHRPLGSVMRARKVVYEKSVQFRGERNGKRIEEPTSAEGIPS